MPNMNHYEDPCIYGLVHDGRVFYIGYTSINALNRWWQHRSRANSGHGAPVYQYMRSVGVENVGWVVVRLLQDGEDAKAIEAAEIKRLLDEGKHLLNQIGRDGTPDSLPPEMKARIGLGNRGRKSWITGKTGEEAGWTEARRKATAEARRATRIPKHGTLKEGRDRSCDCRPCQEALGAWMGRGLPKQLPATTSPGAPKWQVHGEVACYKNGKCRCEACSKAYRDYKRSLPQRAKMVAEVREKETP